MKTGVVATLCAIVFIALSLIVYQMSVNNRLVSLENMYTKQKAAIETYHDKMWKTIKSQAKVTDKQKDAFKEIYVSIMQGRYSGGSKDGSLMKWIKEDNPKFDQSSYLKLMTTIEAMRDGFFREQDTIQGIVKEHNDVMQQEPSAMFVSSTHKLLTFVPISSTKSKAVMQSHVDDDLGL